MSGAEPFLLAAATGMQVVSAIGQANAQNAAAKSAANVAMSNKLAADQDRQQNIRNAQIAGEDEARANRRRLADMRASMGSSGLEFGGSPLDALADSSIEMALDQRRTEYGGYIANRNGAIQMRNFDDEAAAARASKTSPWMSAGAALLSGGAKTYSSFEKNGYFK